MNWHNEIKAFNSLESFNKELQTDSEIIEITIDKFKEYVCSKDYDLNVLKNYPEQLKGILATINFDKVQFEK